MFDELHQSLIPGRAFQLLDLGLDVFGVLVGISLFAFSKPRVLSTERPLMRLMKRLIDIFASLFGLVILSPFLILIVIIIKRDSSGPVFYKGVRSAKGGGTFKMLKFRTMYENPASYSGPKVTSEDDPRITRVGTWLRDTKLNELPQLWNVLAGAMSLVGPRPEDPSIVADWPEEVRREILSVRPGITSPATVLFRNEEAMLKNDQVMEIYLNSIAPSKIRLDQLYVRHQSLGVDLDAIFWTLLILLPRLGSYKPPETQLFFGPLSRFSQRYIHWFAVDFFTVLVSFGLAGIFWRSFGPIDLGWSPAAIIAFGFSLLFSIIGSVVGIQKIYWSKASPADVIDLVFTVVLAFTVSLLINGYFAILPIQIVLLASIFSFIGFVAIRYRTRLITGFATRWINLRSGAKIIRDRILIIGCGEAGQFAAWMFENSSNSTRYHVMGYTDDDLTKQGSRIKGIEVLGRGEDIKNLVDERDIGIIIFAIHNIKPKERKELLEICYSTRAQVVIFPDVMQALNIANVQNANNEKRPSDPESKGEIPQEMFGISRQFIDQWLTELSRDLNEGKVSEGIARLQDLRNQLNNSMEKNAAVHVTAEASEEIK